jgi:hypothetical protein
MWVAGAFLLPSIVHNAGLRKFSRNRNCRKSVDALLILKGRLSEHARLIERSFLRKNGHFITLCQQSS